MGAKVKINPLTLLLTLGHICVDMVQGGIAAVIPFLVLQNGFSYAAATMLVFAMNIGSAVIQPLFGWIGDRVARPWLLAAGVLLAGLGMTGIGIFSTYWLVVVSALVSGVGNAMVHPEGGRLANLMGGESKAESMSLFSVGGQIGFCIGPIITVATVSALGLEGMVLFSAVCIPVAAVLLSFNKKFLSFGVREKDDEPGALSSDHWGLFALVCGACSARSIVFYATTSFVPLILVESFVQTEQFASSMITVFAAVGAVATLASGPASRRIRTTRLTICCFVLLGVAVAAFNLSLHLALSIALVMVIACGLNLFNPPAITLGQHFVPKHLGMASGLTFGTAVAVGGVSSPLLGLAGDAVGLDVVMWIVFFVTILGLAISICLAKGASRYGRL